MTLGTISGYQPYDTSGFSGSSASIQGNGDSVNEARKASPADCNTCKERKYQDGSNENVSFKSASHISPDAAASAVRSHEGEHVSNAYSKASQNHGKVVSASVSIRTSSCPECGRTYVSGGTTNTMIKYSDETNPYQQNQKTLDALRFTGNQIDYVA